MTKAKTSSNLVIKEFTKSNLVNVRAIIDAKFKEIYKETGIELQIGRNIRFSTDSFSSKLTARIVTEGSSSKQMEFNDNCWKHGLTAKDYGKKFKYDNQIFIITGCNTRRTKSPIYVTNELGKNYRMPVEFVKNALK